MSLKFPRMSELKDKDTLQELLAKALESRKIRQHDPNDMFSNYRGGKD